MAHPGDVEILIHIAAPSRASDDVRYRALASAYLDFQPTRHIQLPDQPAESAADETPALANTSQRTRSQLPEREGTQLLASLGEYLPSLTSPQASFGSVLDNANSPLWAGRERVYAPHTQGVASQDGMSQSSWRTPPSVVQDSVPENDAAASMLTTPTRVMEHYLQNFHSPSPAPQAASQQRHVLQRKGQRKGRVSQKSGLSQSFSNLDSDTDYLLTIPCTPGTVPSQELGTEHNIAPGAQPSQDSGNAKQGSSNEAASSKEEVVGNSMEIHEEDIPAFVRADSEPPPSKRPWRDRLKDHHGLLRTTSDIGQQSSAVSSREPLISLSTNEYDDKRLDIQAPEPPVSCAQLSPDDLLTPELSNLASALDMTKRFKPETSARDLRPFERGYWRVNCADWTLELRTATWIFLANHVGTGASGWGVSCHRDDKFTTLRIYCWGAVVGHIYLLLYLASERRVLFTGATWVDGDGIDVIVMGKRARVWKRMQSIETASFGSLGS
jgi:hypothetical protein